MKSDISRNTFDPARHFSRVLMQQGRVTLDADWNEQSDILLHYLRTLARDLIGPHAAPFENAGFLPTVDADGKLQISVGRYYVDGILVENNTPCTYDTQPDYSLPNDDPFLKELSSRSGDDEFWLYLDVWERHITAIDDDRIREVALGGPDTCTRAKVVWQLKALPVAAAKKATALKIKQLKSELATLQKMPKAADGSVQPAIQARMDNINAELIRISRAGANSEMTCDAPLTNLASLSAASLAARLDPGQKIEDPCVTPADSKYRGTENLLYRVEIHTGGAVGDATFKWSRDNGSGETAWLGTFGDDLKAANMRGFSEGDWVELSHDALDLHGQAGPLVRLTKAENGMLSVDPDSLPSPDALQWNDQLKNPRARRWSQTQNEDIVLRAGAIPVTETSATDEGWIDLEDGIQIRFGAGGVYRTGDYWLIPARVATGGIEWPLTNEAGGAPIPSLLPPRGIEHHYAPLGFLTLSGENQTFRPCQCTFEPLSSCFVRAAAAAAPPPPEPALASASSTKDVAVGTTPKRARVRKKTPKP